MADSEVIKRGLKIKQKKPVEGKRAFSCWRCSYSSDWRSNLRSHVKRIHQTSIAMFECCGINFPVKSAFEHHTVQFHPRRYICKSCGRGFFQASNLKRHSGTKSCHEKLSASLIEHATPCNGNLDLAIQLHEDEDDSSSGSSSSVDSSSHSPDPVDSFRQDSSSLDVRLNETFACTRCPFKTKWRTSLTRHKRKARHRKIPVFPGVHCDTKKSYQKNAAMFHQQRLICATCNQVFSTSSLLRSHQTTCPKDKSFQCNLCDFAALHLWNLKSHKAHRHKADNPATTLSDQSTLLDSFTTEETHPNKEGAKVPRVPSLRNARSPFAGRKVHVSEHSQIAKDVLTGSEPFKSELKNKNGANQEASILSCPKCSYSTKWRHALARHIKVHEKQGISSPNSALLTMQQITSPSKLAHLNLLPSEGLRRSGRLAVKPAPSSPSENSSGKWVPQPLMTIKSIHEEARLLRSQFSLVETVSSLLSLLLRLLELCSYTRRQIHAALEVEVRSEAIECFEYVWNASKMAINRWEQLKGEMNDDTSLNAVQYVYGTLPVFANWEKNEHLDMLGNVILLTLNTVENWQQPSAKREST